MSDNNTLHVDCSCHAVEHSLRFTYFDDLEASTSNIESIMEGKYPQFDDIVYLDIFLSSGYLSFWERVKNTYKYLLNRERAFGDFDCTLASDADDLEKIKDFIEKIRCSDNQIVEETHNYIGINNRKNTLRVVKSDNIKNVHSEIVFFVMLKFQKNIFKRIWRSLEYVFCFKGAFDEFEIKREHVYPIVSLIEGVSNNASKRLQSRTES